MQAAAFYLGMLAYYWVLATPSVGFLFGAYLYVGVNWFHVHYDEAFSSLQIADHKGFSRLHVTLAGDLHIYGLAMDKVGACSSPCNSKTPPVQLTRVVCAAALQEHQEGLAVVQGPAQGPAQAGCLHCVILCGASAPVRTSCSGTGVP